MRYSLGFGKTKIEFDINQKNIYKELVPNKIEDTEEILKGAAEVKRAMENPYGSPRLRDIVKKGEKVVIVTSDITRPMPSKIVLPIVVDELNEAGIPDEDITVVFALGSHRGHTEDEKRYIVGDAIYNRIRCIDSDTKDYVALGYTKSFVSLSIQRILL